MNSDAMVTWTVCITSLLSTRSITLTVPPVATCRALARRLRCRARRDRGPPQGRADLRVPRRRGDVGHAGPGRRAAQRAGAPEPLAAVLDLDAVLLALGVVAPHAHARRAVRRARARRRGTDRRTTVRGR